MTSSSSEKCSNCGIDAKCRRRDFSEKAWKVLLVWKEIQPSAVDQVICEDCYAELRDVLIDRADEIDEAIQSHAEISATVKKDSSSQPKERKAS